MKLLFPSRFHKVLVLVLSLILILGLSGCSGNEPSGEALICSVACDNLEVHKAHRDGSRVLSHLPLDLEIEILEQKTVDEINWGRIDKMTLADGTKIKAGWVNLEHVNFPQEPTEPEEVPVETNPEPEPTGVVVNMGTVTAGKLNVRKGPDSGYEVVGSYTKGDRIEILETKTVDDTIWGHTSLGWVGMGYVRKDGTAIPDDQKNADARKVTTDGNSKVLGYGVVDLGELNVRLGPGTEFGKVRSINQGARYAYYQVINDWVRIEDGWVRTDYFYLEGTEADDGLSVEVTTDDLNIRTGPNTSFRSCGTFQKGETIEILAQVGSWGYTEKGWVFMNYVEQVEPTYTTGTYMVISGLNIRQEPNADSEIVGTYTEGDTVTILEVHDNWGRTDKGWINLKFVSLG